jgi:hypothetical protein
VTNSHIVENENEDSGSELDIMPSTSVQTDKEVNSINEEQSESGEERDEGTSEIARSDRDEVQSVRHSNWGGNDEVAEEIIPEPHPAGFHFSSFFSLPFQGYWWWRKYLMNFRGCC